MSGWENAFKILVEVGEQLDKDATYFESRKMFKRARHCDHLADQIEEALNLIRSEVALVELRPEHQGEVG